MRTRSRGTTSSNSGGSPSGGGKSFLRRGADIRREAEHAQEEAAKRREAGANAQRFFLKGGEECEIIILDDSLDKAVAFYEHGLWNEVDKTMTYEPCIKDFGDCPLCRSGNTSYYVMMLSVLVLQEFTTKKGTYVPWSKKLLPVKVGQFDLFQRLEAAAKKEAGTMRGMYLVMARSKTDKQSARIGEPIILDNGKMYDIISEKELNDEYGHDEVKGQDGKTVVRPKNFDITPFDYDKLFPMPDVEAIQQEDGRPRRGSTEEALAEFEGGGQEQQEEQPSGRRRRGSPEPEEDQPSGRRGQRGVNPFED